MGSSRAAVKPFHLAEATFSAFLSALCTIFPCFLQWKPQGTHGLEVSLAVGCPGTVCSFTQTINKSPAYMAMLFQAAEIPRTEIPTKDHFHPASPRHRRWGLCCQGTLGVQRKERCEGKSKSPGRLWKVPFNLDFKETNKFVLDHGEGTRWLI